MMEAMMEADVDAAQVNNVNGSGSSNATEGEDDDDEDDDDGDGNNDGIWILWILVPVAVFLGGLTFCCLMFFGKMEDEMKGSEKNNTSGTPSSSKKTGDSKADSTGKKTSSKTYGSTSNA